MARKKIRTGLKCKQCGSTNMVRTDKLPSGKINFQCRNCYTPYTTKK